MNGKPRVHGSLRGSRPVSAYVEFLKPTRCVGKEVVMLLLLAGLLLAFLPFLLFLGPIVVWAAWPSLALLAAVYAVHAIQRRRHVSGLAHQS